MITLFFCFSSFFLSMNVYNHNFLILVDAFLYMVRVLFIAFFWGGTYIAHYPDCMSFLGLTHKGQGNTFFLSVLLCCLPVVISSPELKAYLISTCRSSICLSICKHLTFFISSPEMSSSKLQQHITSFGRRDSVLLKWKTLTFMMIILVYE